MKQRKIASSKSSFKSIWRDVTTEFLSKKFQKAFFFVGRCFSFTFSCEKFVTTQIHFEHISLVKTPNKKWIFGCILMKSFFVNENKHLMTFLHAICHKMNEWKSANKKRKIEKLFLLFSFEKFFFFFFPFFISLDGCCLPYDRKSDVDETPNDLHNLNRSMRSLICTCFHCVLHSNLLLCNVEFFQFVNDFWHRNYYIRYFNAVVV